MSLFEINLHNQSTYYHSFATDDMAMQAIGMANYNTSGITKYLAATGDPDIQEFFANAVDTAQRELIGNGLALNTLALLRIEDTATGAYVYKEGLDVLATISGVQAFPNIETLLNKHQAFQLGSLTPTEDEKQVINNIQTSYSGCINFTATFTVLDCPRTPRIRLYLKSRQNNNTSRTVAHNGEMLLSSIPRTPAGTEFSWNNTVALPIGQYASISEGGAKNPNNTVAGKLKTTYNASIGQFESGTQQTYVILLTDIDPAPRANLKNANIASLPASDFYDPTSTNYQGASTKGAAMIMSVENGNTHMFGPNTLGGCALNKQRKEQIEVTNRSRSAYKKGDLVLVSMIGSEWVIVYLDGSAPVESSSKSVLSHWGFQKYICTAKDFFKAGVSIIDPLLYTKITPSEYENKIKSAYYMNMFSGKAATRSAPVFRKLAELNVAVAGAATDPEISCYYSQEIYIPNTALHTTTFDQLGQIMGGVNDYNAIGRTNIAYSPNGIPDDADIEAPKGYMFPSFWGPVFVDGYNAGQVAVLQNLIKSQSESIVKAVGKAPSDIDIYLKDTTVADLLSTDVSYSNLVDETNFMFSDATDGNLKQLPAEAALLGNPAIPSKFTPYGIEILNRLYIYQPEKGWVDNFEMYLCNNTARPRWQFLQTTVPAKDSIPESIRNTYGLTPVNPNKIQFTPLGLEFALSSTLFPATGNPSNSIAAVLQSQIAALKGQYGGDSDERKNLLSAAFTNRGDLTVDGERPNKPAGKNGIQAMIPFGPYVPTWIEPPATPAINGPAPLGGPALIDNIPPQRESSNVIGIIASRIAFTATTAVNFVANQYFGLSPKVTIAGGQANSMTLLGSFLGFGGGNNALLTNAIPQWGDSERNDSYDSFGTTCLHVRIFDAWPIRDTIYDGRYFSVLHFNPRVLDDFDKRKTNAATIGKVSEGDIEFKNGSSTFDSSSYPLDICMAKKNKTIDNSKYKIDNQPWVNRKPLLNANNQQVTDLNGDLVYTYPPLPTLLNQKIDIIETSVDFREPTLINPTATPATYTVLDIGTEVDINGLCFTGNPYAATPDTPSPTTPAAALAAGKLAPLKEWRVNSTRRGLMLGGSTVDIDGGVRYRAKVFGVGVVKVGEVLKKVAGAGGVTEVLKKQGGSGYAVNQYITVDGGTISAIVKVLSVENIPAIAADTLNGISAEPAREGAISSITILSQYKGEGYTTSALGQVGGIPISGGGSGAIFDLQRLVVYDKIQRDIGPRERCPITRLTTPSTAVSTGAGGRPLTSFGDAGKRPVEGSETTNIPLQEGTHKYDAFFFFHNDITHTLSYDTPFTVARQQYVTLTIK